MKRPSATGIPGVRAQRSQRAPYRWVFPAACVLALATVLGAYANSFENSFHFDDSHVVQGNLYIRSLKNVPQFFRDPFTYSSNPAMAGYRPLISASVALDYWLGGGLNLRQFHLSQLTMLVILGIAVFVLFLRLMSMAGERSWTRWAALVAATLYAVHTTNTETLNIMHVRSELISTLGVVASFLIYLYLPRSRRMQLHLLPVLIAAFAKIPAVVFAPLFLVYLWMFEYELSLPDCVTPRAWPRVRAGILRSLPALVLGAGLFIFTESMNSPTLVLGGGSRMEYLRTQTFMWLHYGRMFFVPAGLSADTDWGLIADWYDTRVVAGILFIAMLLRVLWKASRSPESRPVAFGIAWFGLALLPASSIFPLAEVTNDHRPFFAYVGLSLAVVWGVALTFERWSVVAPHQRRLIASGAVVLALFAVGGNAVGTYQRNKVFLTEETLWRDVTEKSPANGRGLMNYGLTQMEQGRYAEAKALFDRALIYTPNYATLEVNLGIVSARLDQPAVAEAHFARALQLQPGYSPGHRFYARWLGEQGRTADAIEHLERALALSSADIDVRHQLLAMYAKAGRTADMRELASATLALAPGDPLATKYLNAEGDRAALEQIASAVDTPAGFLNRSLQFYQVGKFQDSIDAARQALELKPDYPEAYCNISASLTSLGRWDEAIVAANEALRLRPDFRLARNNLAWAEREKQKASQAPR